MPRKCKSIGCNSQIGALDHTDFCIDCMEELGTSANDAKTEPQTTATPLWEKDPLGKSQHEAGAKVDAGKVRMHLITGGMARAITEVAKVGTFGAAKYTDNGWIAVPDGFRRYEDAQQRHAAKRHMGDIWDPDSNLLHLAHECWNAMAKLDLYLRNQEAQAKGADRVGQ